MLADWCDCLARAFEHEAQPQRVPARVQPIPRIHDARVQLQAGEKYVKRLLGAKLCGTGCSTLDGKTVPFFHPALWVARYAVLARGCVQGGSLDKAANVVRAAYRLSPAGMVMPIHAPGVEPRALEEARRGRGAGRAYLESIVRFGVCLPEMLHRCEKCC